MTYSLGAIAERFGWETRGDTDVEIDGIAALPDAEPGQLAFLFNSAWRDHLETTRASAVILRPGDVDAARCPVIIAERPRLAWARVATLFDPVPLPSGEIHPAAVVSESARLGTGVTVEAGAIIAGDVVIGNGATIGARSVVGQGTTVGEGTRLYPNVTLYHGVTLGARTIIHSGAVIGADGFGFELDPSQMALTKIPQVYGVVIGDDVEIGAGTTIDRGALNDTHIGNGVKLDNQVQIGHGSSVGDNTAISGCTAIAGSTHIGRYCLIGGAVGIIDNISIADQVEITAMTLVSRSITESGRYSSGTGFMPSRRWRRNVAAFGKLADILARLRKLEKASRSS